MEQVYSTEEEIATIPTTGLAWLFHVPGKMA